MPEPLKIKIYYEDTDAAGVVYYANYLKYLERARTELLSDIGIGIKDYHDTGYFFAVTHVDIHYMQPARLGDIISVTTETVEMRNASLKIKHLISRDGTPLAEALITVACINKNWKPVRLPEEFKRLKQAQR